MKVQMLYKRTEKNEIIQGVLYTPENLDSTRRYPLMVEVYDQFSNEKNKYILPEDGLGGGPSIPYFVSKGYIFFLPDIDYKQDGAGKATLSSLNNCLDQLNRIPYVDSTRIGLYGHSLGGYEVNYVMGKSHRFKAFGSASSALFLTGEQFKLWENSNQTRTGYLLWGGYRMSTNLWKSPSNWIANEPIFDLDKVSSPLLIMHNPKDGIDYDQHGLGFYIAMRQLRKECWMIEYPDEGHVILKKRNQLDYQEKLLGYFDHFLKGAPRPDWMR